MAKASRGTLLSPRQVTNSKKGFDRNMLSASSVTAFGESGDRELYQQQPQQQRQQQLVENQPPPDSVAPELDLDETLRVREIFAEVVHDEYITTKFDLQVLLSLVGLYPSDVELSFVLTAYENKVSFSNLCNYLRFYKRIFQYNAQRERREGASENLSSSLQDDKDDTLRVFVSLGGNEDSTGTIAVEDLRQICENFGLNVDINTVVNSFGDAEVPTTLTYPEFCIVCRPQPRPAEGSFADTISMSGSAIAARGVNSVSRELIKERAVSRSNPALATGTLGRQRENTPQAFRFGAESPNGGGGFVAGESTSSQVTAMEAHLQSLQNFLFPESAAREPRADEDAMARRFTSQGGKQPFTGGKVGSLSADRLNVDKRSKSYARGESSPSGGAGNYRAPSPIILSLRNITAARERRLRDFSHKSKMKKSGAQNGNNWGNNATMASIDDE